ncbi:hypothetical protein B0H13DRAFT_1857417 [Mycena leptocephala]|nr:hypothetical protein B0H13DRAFT_1857417 [Mycena leptocephala]
MVMRSLTVVKSRNIRTQAQDTIYEATRTSFMMMHTDVVQKLRDNRVTLKLNAVFGNPSREKALVSVLRTSICGNTPATLAQFTYSSANKFKRGGSGVDLDVSFTIHNALLRRFARENPFVIGVEEVDDDDSTEDIGSSPAPPQKKRKITAAGHAGGRIPKGQDFWSQADAFFAKKITEFGSKNLQSAGWKSLFCTPLLTNCQDFDGKASKPSNNLSLKSQAVKNGLKLSRNVGVSPGYLSCLPELTSRSATAGGGICVHVWYMEGLSATSMADVSTVIPLATSRQAVQFGTDAAAAALKHHPTANPAARPTPLPSSPLCAVAKARQMRRTLACTASLE